MNQVIAIVGPECSGKTTLAQALAEHLPIATGQSWTLVTEGLRQWCALRGRTPKPSEQAGIALEQSDRIREAAKCCHVVADTTALMTAVYSSVLFGDSSLIQRAVSEHQSYTLTALCAADFGWQPGDWQRDGPEIQALVAKELDRALAANSVPALRLEGSVARRVASVTNEMRIRLNG